MPRGAGTLAGLYMLCRIHQPDRCSRSLQSARAPGDTLGQTHPFHYTVARASPAPAPGSFARLSLPGAASTQRAAIPWIAFCWNSPEIQPGTWGSLQNPSTTSRSTNNVPKAARCWTQTRTCHPLIHQAACSHLLQPRHSHFPSPKLVFQAPWSFVDVSADQATARTQLGQRLKNLSLLTATGKREIGTNS